VDDTDGNLLDFRRAFLVFTTNAGTEYETKRRLGLPDPHAPVENRAGGPVPRVTVEAVKADLLARGYGEEFFGRQIDFVIFEAMEREDVEKILRRQLGDLESEAVLRGYELSCDEEVVGHLLKEWTPRFGARWVYNILRNRIEEQLALADAQGELREVPDQPEVPDEEESPGHPAVKGHPAVPGHPEVKRIHIVLAPEVAPAEGEQKIAGLASRVVVGDTLTVFVF
jgi:ATP-dependent Clp protease ATP-binding subunit ClpA